MEIQKLLRADYLDILFDGRNKTYGGYELRRKYADRARKATAVVIMSAVVAVTIPVVAASLSRDTRRVMPPVEIVTVLRDVPPSRPDEQPPMPIVEPPAPIAVIENPILRIVEDNQTTTPPATADVVREGVIGPIAMPGIPGNDDESALGGPSGGGRTALVGADTVKPPIHIAVEIMPSFNGELSAYLSSHLRYPEESRSNGDEGRVGVHFVVNEDGSISDVKIIRRAGAALDAEALRVVSNMPKWKPGKQGGKAVKVYFTLPINFELGF